MLQKHMVGWPQFYVNGALMMLAVDTGAALTIVNSEKFLKLLDRSLLQPSEHTFYTAAGITLPALGQFSATLELGPVKVHGLITTVADVVGDGLLFPEISRRLGRFERRKTAHESGRKNINLPTTA
jgi:predicted aspartyl protease